MESYYENLVKFHGFNSFEQRLIVKIKGKMIKKGDKYFWDAPLIILLLDIMEAFLVQI